MNHPVFKSRKTFIYYTSIWLILLILRFIVLSIILDFETGAALSDSFLFCIMFYLIGISLWYPSRYISFEGNSNFKIIGSHLVASTVIVFIWEHIYTTLISFLSSDPEHLIFVQNSFYWNLFIGYLLYAVIVSLYYINIYYNNYKEKVEREAELKTLVKEAELKNLKFQINPHFIFNSLNSIKSLTSIDPEKAGLMTLKLADFLRYTLSNNIKQKNKLIEELYNVKLYLDIEKIRFEDKFEYVEEIEDLCNNLLVPNMILQPLYENAIKHAVYETLDKVSIKLSCKRDGDYARITLTNNFDNIASGRKGEGVGLVNIKERLKLIYGKENLFDVKRRDKEFIVSILIPLDE